MIERSDFGCFSALTAATLVVRTHPGQCRRCPGPEELKGASPDHEAKAGGQLFDWLRLTDFGWVGWCFALTEEG